MYASILKRVGGVLILLGIFDIAVMVYCIFNGISYSSSLNLFAVIAGIFIFRGSLRAASNVRWFAVFLLATLSVSFFALPFLQPLSLTMMQVRLNPMDVFLNTIYIVSIFGLLCWVIKELGRAPIQAAIVQAGLKSRNMRIPAALGISLVVILGIYLMYVFGGERASHARALAEEQIGQGYRLHIKAIKLTSNNQRTFISSEVTAWNDQEIKTLSVRWEEK